MKIIDFFKKTTWKSSVILALWLAFSALIMGVIISEGPKEYVFQRTLLALVVWISCSVFFWLPVVSYQKAITHQENSTPSEKSWITTLLLSIFLGRFGIHRFYTGRIISGVVFCLTMGGFGIGWIIDVLAIALNMFTDGKGYIISKKNEPQNNSASDFQTNKKQERHKTNHKKPLPGQVVLGVILCAIGGFLSFTLLMPIIAITDKEFFATVGQDGIAAGSVMGFCGLILLALGICYLKGKFVDSALARKEQKARTQKMRLYSGIYLTEERIHNLENKTELPIVDTPIFLQNGEVAVYYCQAIRQETKNRVIGRTGGYSGGTVRIAKGFSIHTGSSSSHPVYGDVSTHYDGELVLTNKRLVFLSDQKGFEVPYSAITAATAYRDGLSVQSRSHTYTLLLPKADLALLAFDAVRTGEIPIASSHGDSYNNAFENSEVDCSELIYVEDELFEDAVDTIIETGQASVSILQRKLKIGYSRAAHLIDELEKHGIVSSFEGSRPRQILISDSEWEEMRDWITFGEEDYSEVDTEETKQTPNVSEIDGMDGHEFEYFCADLLRKNGFVNVKVTPGSGDQGVDILAEKGGIKYAIQCKNYASPLSNTPVQEVNAGKVFYGCHVGVVMTNSTFTPGASALAQATGVLLWDRVALQSMIENID